VNVDVRPVPVIITIDELEALYRKARQSFECGVLVGVALAAGAFSLTAWLLLP
jgi:hypothetical protein